MLKCSTSLWSADLANLAAEIKRVEPYTERFHLDVADGHYVPSMLFFPDLVKSLRKHTSKPFEVHLMTTDPSAWIEPFVEAGADGVIFCFDSLEEPGSAIKQVKDLGKFVGDLAPGDRAGQPAAALLEHDRPGDDRGYADGDQGDLDGTHHLRQDPGGASGDREVFGQSRDPGRRRHPAQHGPSNSPGRCRLDRSGVADVRRRPGGDAAVAWFVVMIRSPDGAGGV